MSNGGGIIIICGSGGSPVTDKIITVYDAAVSVAIKVDKTELIVQAQAANPTWSHEKVTRKVNQFAQRVERDYWSWGEELEELGVTYHRHEPHQQP